MNTKSLGLKVGIGGFALAFALAGAGCSGAQDDGSQVQEAEAATPSDVAQTSSPSTIIHATVSLGEDHEVQFVEFQPGLLGLIETGRAMLDVPMVTPEVTRLTWTEQYRHFAGPSVSLPKEMLGAVARAARATSISVPPTAPPPITLPHDTVNGPHFYTAGEQTWFNQTFCNGAEICNQRFDSANMQTPHKVNHYSVFAMIGAEGTNNGSLETFFWKCGAPLLFPTICYWIALSSTVIVPGHFINSTFSQQNGSWFFLWQIRSGGSGTLVSGSADF